jgi:hypothetical protein
MSVGATIGMLLGFRTSGRDVGRASCREFGLEEATRLGARAATPAGFRNGWAAFASKAAVLGTTFLRGKVDAGRALFCKTCMTENPIAPAQAKTSCEMSKGMIAQTTAATSKLKLVASFGFAKSFNPD